MPKLKRFVATFALFVIPGSDRESPSCVEREMPD
jgi:hypothetical protein